MVVMIRKTGPKKPTENKWGSEIARIARHSAARALQLWHLIVPSDCLPSFPAAAFLSRAYLAPGNTLKMQLKRFAMRCNLIQNRIVFHNCFTGEVRRFFYWLKVFYWPQTKRSFKKQFSPKWVKNQAKGSKIHKIRTKWHPTYCGNPSILSTDLLWKSTNSVLGATVGIHFLQIDGFPQ